MRVGLTFDLKEDHHRAGMSEEETAEYDTIETIELVEAAIRRAGHEVDRIGHVRSLAARLVAGDRWDIVFNTAEGARGVSREAQVPALLDAYGVPFVFSDALTMTTTLHKATAKRIVRDAGVPTAPFAVVERATDLPVDIAFPLFVKPVAEGSSKGVSERSVVRDAKALEALALELLPRYPEGLLVEEFLPGREFTIGIVGTGPRAEVVGALEILILDKAAANAYGRDIKRNWKGRMSWRLADDATAQEAARIALLAWRALRCFDAGRVDVRCDARGAPQFVEVNPIAGLDPANSDLPILAGLAGLPFDALIARILDEAKARTGVR
jgi:D-alanine-D-alanine ligase